MRLPAVLRAFLMLLPLLAGMPVRADDPQAAMMSRGLAPALSARDVDVEHCRALHDGQPVAFEPGDVLDALGLGAGARGWSAGAVSKRSEAGEKFLYLLTFNRPLPIGALLCEKRDDQALDRSVFALKADAPFPPDPTDKKQWEPVAFPASQAGLRSATFPVGFKTRALLTEDVRHDGTSSIGLLRLFATRLYNALPASTPTASSEYTAYSDLAPPVPFTAERLIRGEFIWQSNGPEGQVVRGPAVSDINPAWFVVQWEAPRTINGLYLDDNFEKVRFYAYTGPAGLNPVIGTDDEWTRIKYDEHVTLRNNHRERWVEFDQPLSTRSIKVEITETPAREVQIARITGFQALGDLGAAAVPEVRVAEERPPYIIHYDLPRSGMTTVAIDGPDGHRVRNLFAREQREKGPNQEAWDLKDEDGRPVKPGTYTLKVLCNPGIVLSYQMTPYPNIGENSPENSPWLNGESGSGGWLADHTSNSSVIAAGDRVYVGAPCSESGVSLIECDLTGRKLWGCGNFLAWTGPQFLAADDQYVYGGIAPNPGLHGDLVYRVRMKDKQIDKALDLPGTGARKRGLVGIAARDGKVFLSIRSGETALGNAAVAEDVDLDRCVPPYAKIDRASHDSQASWIPDKRNEFPGLFRLTEEVPGHRGLLTIETMKVESPRQHVVLAFNKPIAIGSLVFPINRDVPMRLSMLKAGVNATPDPSDESQWEQFWQSPKEPAPQGTWTVVPAPKAAMTRALRLTFAKAFDEIEDALVADEKKEKDKDLPDLIGQRAGSDDKQPGWSAGIEGMKILRRRFASLLPGAKVLVNSGKVNADGEWDAQRTEPLSTAHPGIYALQWEQPQKIRGLAIKEIDGKLTEIDAWDGPADGAIDIQSSDHWKKIASYEQKRRMFGAVEAHLGPNNASARYLDGYVDFGADVSTRAIRLRVVEQWPNNGPVGATGQGVRDDREAMQISFSRCRVYGVAPLQSLGDETPVDPMIGARLEEWDTTSGDLKHPRLVAEVPFPQGGQLTMAPDGSLLGISAGKVVRIDMSTGILTPVVSDLIEPTSLTVDKAGALYVLDNAPQRKVIRVYDKSGKYHRDIGQPGGYTLGAWAPQHIDAASAISIDHTGGLWHTEASYWPKRLVCWNASDGTVKKQFLGNTQYGGGGVLDPKDKTRLYYGPLEFTLDWDTGKSQLKNLMWRGSSAPGELPVYINGRQYMVTHANNGNQPDGGAGTVYIYEKGINRAVAAAGPAGYYPPFMEPDFQAAYAKAFPGKPLAAQRFLWTDINGDGKIQIDEVQFSPLPERFRCGYFDLTDLSLATTAHSRYEVSKFLDNGVPVYLEKAYPNLPGEPTVKLANGDSLCMYVSDFSPSRTARLTPDGKEVWAYHNEGFSGFAYPHATPWAPGKVVSEFDIIGQGKSIGGDLGGFFVENDNVGQWNVYTDDGLLAGWIFLELRNPQRKAWSMPEHQRGLHVEDVTAGQEHFQGYFCQTADGKFYVVAGHNHASVVEVLGLNDFKRADKKFEITPQDLESIRSYDATHFRKLAYQNVKVMDCYPMVHPLSMDGDAGDWGSQPAGAKMPGIGFKMTFDDRYLYLLWDTRGKGPLKNAGNDWRTLFRTGACVDLQLGIDPAADPARTEPARGDLRVLISMMNDKPVAVLSQAIAPGAAEADHKEYHTGVARTLFDRVVQIDGAVIGHRESADGYVLEAALPLEALGLKISDHLRLKMDWGILQSGPGGNEVLDHLYWSNKIPVAFDEAVEASLHPDLWGYVRFSTRSRAETQAPKATGASHILEGDDTTPKKKKTEDIEDELEKGAVK